jgi:hypothetical protein
MIIIQKHFYRNGRKFITIYLIDPITGLIFITGVYRQDIKHYRWVPVTGPAGLCRYPAAVSVDYTL